MKGVAHVTDYCRYVFTLILCIIKSVGIINCTKKYVQVRDLWYYYNIISTKHYIINFMINSVIDINNNNVKVYMYMYNTVNVCT